jgi:hypothetical protein
MYLFIASAVSAFVTWRACMIALPLNGCLTVKRRRADRYIDRRTIVITGLSRLTSRP